METILLFLSGLVSALEPSNLLLALAGCIIGTLVGVLPGIGPVAGIAILLPVTYSLDATGALVMLAAIYYGSMYGGTITSVLMNVPGEAASVITAVEGHAMAKKGRAGSALTIAALASFVGGTFATLCIVFLAQPLTQFGLRFGPPEFFALVLVGFTLLLSLAGNSIVKAGISAMFGLALTLPGLNPTTGVPRMTFGHIAMLDGFDLVVVLMGLFGISEILLTLEQRTMPKLKSPPLREMMPTREEWRRSSTPTIRGTLVGFAIGIVPGLGAATAAFLSYALEKRVSRFRSFFGNGAIEGVASPEAANNAAANASLLPLLTLGLPGSASVAILMGAFLMNGITPGPFLFRDHPDLVWTLIASMVVGNVILVVLNVPLVGLWTRLLSIPYAYLFTFILVFALVGAFSIRNSMFDVNCMLVFGAAGYFLRKLDFPIAPIALTLVLGPQFEMSLYQSLNISNGDYGVFFRSGISTTLICTAIFVLLLSAVGPAVGLFRKPKQAEESEV
ncbi:MAG: transporter [Pelagibacterium sp. SCN 64-44]|nr:MAG: transporter [Pelagibacterium sp. SCN 64-44]